MSCNRQKPWREGPCTGPQEPHNPPVTPSQGAPEGCRRPGPPSCSSLSCHPTARASPAGLLQPLRCWSGCKGSLRARSTRVRLREHISACSLLGGERRARGIWEFCLEHARFNCLRYQLLMHSCGRALACSLFAQRCGNVMQLWYCCDERSYSEAPGGKPCPRPQPSPQCHRCQWGCNTAAPSAVTPCGAPTRPSRVLHFWLQFSPRRSCFVLRSTTLGLQAQNVFQVVAPPRVTSTGLLPPGTSLGSQRCSPLTRCDKWSGHVLHWDTQ